MIGALAYLAARSAANRLRRQARELRRPRYAAAVLLGIGYISYVALVETRPPEGLPDPRLLELLGAVALFAAAGWAWIFTPERRALAFTPAEATFLFPAPLTRRQLVLYKLVRSQGVILLNVLLWTLLLGRTRGDLPAALYAIGVWLLLSTLSLHRLGASFVRSSLAEHGWHGARQRRIALLVLGVGVALLLTGLAQALPQVSAGWGQDAGAFLAALAEAAEHPLVAALLAPFRLVVRPLVASTAAAWGAAVWPAALVLLAHAVWVVRSDTAFEEAALDAALTRARRLRPDDQDGSGPRAAGPPIVRLRPTGHPGGALVWKNLVAVTRGRRIGGWFAALAAAGIVLVTLSLRGDAIAEMAGALLLTWSGFAIALGPLWVRNDLRTDLAKLELLRSYPLPGAAVVTAEVIAATLVLSAIQLALLLLTYLALVGSAMTETDLLDRTAILVLATLVLPVLNLVGFTVQNGAALLFPAWVRVGARRAGGVEALGQHFLLLAVFWLVMALALAPPVAAGMLLATALKDSAPVPAAAVGLTAGLGVIAVEVRVALGWLGGIFERTEPGVVLPSG